MADDAVCRLNVSGLRSAIMAFSAITMAKACMQISGYMTVLADSSVMGKAQYCCRCSGVGTYTFGMAAETISIYIRIM
jgi:hypothetical protein